jgi:hypothetical protein
MPRQKLWLLIALLFLSLLCIGVFAGYIYKNIRQYQAEDKIVLAGISKQTGLKPDWLAIREYVYCDLLKLGTPKDKVVTGLSLIGKNNADVEDTSPTINFSDPHIDYNLSPLFLEYNQDWILIDSGAGEFNHGPRSSCEIERANKAQTPQWR